MAALGEAHGVDELGGEETVADLLPHRDEALVEGLPVGDEDLDVLARLPLEVAPLSERVVGAAALGLSEPLEEPVHN